MPGQPLPRQTERRIAPHDYAVGFTDRGKACHAQPPSHNTALCGAWLAQAWSRQIDQDNLNVTCRRCIAALEAEENSR